MGRGSRRRCSSCLGTSRACGSKWAKWMNCSLRSSWYFRWLGPYIISQRGPPSRVKLMPGFGTVAFVSNSFRISCGRGTWALDKSLDRQAHSKFAFLPRCSGLYLGSGSSGSSFLICNWVINICSGGHKGAGGAV